VQRQHPKKFRCRAGARDTEAEFPFTGTMSGLFLPVYLR
jgi:hypothetical protein